MHKFIFYLFPVPESFIFLLNVVLGRQGSKVGKYKRDFPIIDPMPSMVRANYFAHIIWKNSHCPEVLIISVLKPSLPEPSTAACENSNFSSKIYLIFKHSTFCFLNFCPDHAAILKDFFKDALLWQYHYCFKYKISSVEILDWLNIFKRSFTKLSKTINNPTNKHSWVVSLWLSFDIRTSTYSKHAT